MRDKIKQIADKACKKSMKKFEKGIEALKEGGGIVPGNVKPNGVDVDFVTSREVVIPRADVLDRVQGEFLRSMNVESEVVSRAKLIKLMDYAANALLFKDKVKILDVRVDARLGNKTVIDFRHIEGSLADDSKTP